MVKVISLSEKAYTTLKSLKESKESFSDVVLKLAKGEKKKSLVEFAGLWKDKPDMDKTFKSIIDERQKFRDRRIDVKW